MARDLPHRLADLRLLLAEKLGVTGRDLQAQVRRAGRRLPRRLRGEARLLVEAEAMSRHPRLSRLIDRRRAARAHDRVGRHLGAIDPLALRRARRLDRLALWGFYVLVTGGLVIAALVWRGLV